MRWFTKFPFLPLEGRRLALGLGLIGVGKPWGYREAEVPPEAQVRDLLETALELGIRFFDTAPSYGLSEGRFGRFLQELPAEQRQELVIATKFGEHWDPKRQQPFVDHSYDALARSLDGSLKRLGQIDILELHKTTPEALRSPDVQRALEYAASLGIHNLGASVSDPVSAKLVLDARPLSVVQFPLHLESTQFQELATEASGAGMLVLTNRPFGMGRLLHEGERVTPESAFAFLVGQHFDGVVLTGTKSAVHLRENYEAFQAALANNGS